MRAKRVFVSLLLMLLTVVHSASLQVCAQDDKLPSRFDPVQQAKVSAVRQSPQGSALCWAYATIGAVEQNLIFSGLDNTSADLSESALAWFSSDSEKIRPTDSQRYSYNYIYAPVFAMSRLCGLQHEADEPMFLNDPSMNKVSYSQIGISDYELEKMEKIAADRDTIKQKITEYGGAAVCYYNDDEYFSSDHKSYYQNSNIKENHAVTVIGWDDDYSKDLFGSIKPSNNGAWLVKGVWGTRHDNGYYWISYEEPEMKEFFFYKVDKTHSDRVYTHNSGIDKMYASGKNIVQAANVFTADSDEQLNEISFMIEENGGQGTEYTVRVYKDLKEGTPVGSELCADIKGSVQYDGYYTVKFSSPIALSAGEKFSVAVSVKSKNEHNYFVCEDASCTAHEGESYYCTEGTNWQDCIHTQFRNAYINAYTTKKTEPSKAELQKLIDDNSGKKGMQRSVRFANAVIRQQKSDSILINKAEKLIQAAGNECDSYTVITTADEWNEFAKSVNEGNQYRNRMVVVEADIDFKDTDFICAGSSQYKCFNGYFDGNGHVFSNITLKDLDGDPKGIFGYVGQSASIRELVVSKSSISADVCGGIAGICDGATLTACGYSGSMSGKVSGGIVGKLNCGTVSDCWSVLENSTNGGIIAQSNENEHFCVLNCFSDTPDKLSSEILVSDTDKLVEMLNTNANKNKSVERFERSDGIIKPAACWNLSGDSIEDNDKITARSSGIGTAAVICAGLIGGIVIVFAAAVWLKHKKR